MNENGHRADTVVGAKKFLETRQGAQLSLFKVITAKVSEVLTGRETIREAGPYGGPEAPWSPVPLKQARDWLRADETRKVNFVFPTVFEEDRSTKIKDISTAQGLDYISHQRAAEMVAQEMEVENFDWLAEMEKIQTERKQFGDVLPAPGAGLGGSKMGGITIGAPAPGLAAEDDLGDDEDEPLEIPGAGLPRIGAQPSDVVLKDHNADISGKPHRAERSGDFTARFKKQQRETAKLLRSMNRGIQAMIRNNDHLTETQKNQLLVAQSETQVLREAIAKLGEKIAGLGQAPAPVVNVPAPVVNIPAPVVNVTLPDHPAPPLTKRVITKTEQGYTVEDVPQPAPPSEA